MCDGFVNCGGVSEVIRNAYTCAEFNKPFWLQWVGTDITATMALHLQAVMSHARWPSISCNHMYEEQVIQEKIHVSNGMADVPDRPGLGITVDWDLVEKYRIEPKEKPFPYPGLLLRLDWPTGAKSYFTHTMQMWDEFERGRLPAFTRGVHLTRVEDDGSNEWKQLYEEARQGPLYRES